MNNFIFFFKINSISEVFTRENRSAINDPLIFASSGESVLREGDKLTSSTQGLRFESISTSNPKT